MRVAFAYQRGCEIQVVCRDAQPLKIKNVFNGAHSRIVMGEPHVYVMVLYLTPFLKPTKA